MAVLKFIAGQRRTADVQNVIRVAANHLYRDAVIRKIQRADKRRRAETGHKDEAVFIRTRRRPGEKVKILFVSAVAVMVKGSSLKVMPPRTSRTNAGIRINNRLRPRSSLPAKTENHQQCDTRKPRQANPNRFSFTVSENHGGEMLH